METAKIKELVSRMTLEEKASLCSGLDFWHTKGVERLGIPSEMVSDGPHGLRKRTIKQTIWESTTAFRLFAFQRDVQPHPALTVSW